MPHTWAPVNGSARRIISAISAALLVMTLVVFAPTTAFAAHVPANNAVGQHFAWNPDTGAWSTGQPKGYTEGETAPFRLTMAGATAGAEYYVNICLEVGSGTGPYAFTAYEPWDKTYDGVLQNPTNTSPPLTGTDGQVFRGVGLTINTVNYGGLGAGGCTSDYLNAYVEFTMADPLVVNAFSDTASNGGIVYGGHIAAPGDPLPSGAGSATVPSGKGAGSINGVFQANVGDGGGGNKTVNFKGSDIAPVLPEIDIEKLTNGQDADAAPGPYAAVGSTVNWTYLVTNTGSNDLANVDVTDNQGVTVSCPAAVLAAGASMECTGIGVAVPGQYANIGSVVATDSFGAEAEDSDPSHYFGVGGSLVIEKSTNGQDADAAPGPNVAVGSTVNWVYEVTNNSNATVTGIAVTDDQGVTVTCPAAVLAAGASMDCTASGPATAGQYANLGSVTGTDAAGVTLNDSDPSHYFGVGGSLVIEKSTNGQDADTPTGPYVAVGSTVDWVYEVTNNSNATVTGIAVTDDQGVTVTCPAAVLAAGASMDCTASGAATAGQYANIGSVTGTDAAGAPVEDSDPSHYFGVTGTLSIEKATNGQDADTPTGPNVAVGSTVDWTYEVTNNSNATVTGISVTDDQGVTVTCPSDELAPGESMTCTASDTAVAGQYANIGTVTGTDAAGAPVEDSDPSHYFGVEVTNLSILKLVSDLTGGWEPSAVYPNSTTDVTWQITVSNTGPTDLNEVSLDDVNAPSCVDAFADAIAAAGWEIAGSLTMPSDESVTFECSSTVAASAPGSNTAVATGFDVLGRQVGPVQSTAFITRVAASGTIGDTVWYDTNANGVQDGSEPGIANVPVKLVANDGQDVDPVTAGVQTTITMTTNANGNYLFSGLPAGSYTVSVALSSVPNAGTTPLRFTTPGSYTIGLPDGGSVLTADFGVVADTLPVTGLSTDSILPVALLLLLAGAMAVFATRRKDHG